MDQVFGQLSCLQMEHEPDLAYIDDPKELMNEMSMDLDDFKFDLDTISDSLGSWIQPDELKLDTSDIEDDIDIKSESIDFADLNITEAVRYDCMWSSHPSIFADNKKPQQPISENSLFEEFLKIIDIPSQFDLDLDIKSEAEDQGEIKTQVTNDCDKSRIEQENDVRLYTSLDHCYVSTTGPPSDKHSYSDNFPVTPPESSEDEESQQTSPFPHVINPASTSCIRSHSLLKRSRKKSGGEAKFCFKLKLKSDNSRSLLKHKLRLVNNATKRQNLGIMNKNMVQTSVRRRKEESLKLKHHEAREIHNHMERQRRNELKVAFDDLKACIPHIANSEKVSKQMILDTALESCKQLKSREISMKMKKDRLKRAHAELKQRLSNLQRTKDA